MTSIESVEAFTVSPDLIHAPSPLDTAIFVKVHLSAPLEHGKEWMKHCHVAWAFRSTEPIETVAQDVVRVYGDAFNGRVEGNWQESISEKIRDLYAA